MAARPALVSQTEIKRTLQAALSAGLRIGRVEVDHATGRVVVFPEGAPAQAAGPDPDALLRWRGAKNRYPGVRKNVVKGRIYWKFERGDFRINIPGPHGSAEFLAAYEAALAGSWSSNTSTALPGTVAWLIEQYLCSLRFQNLSDSRKRTIRHELDWLRQEAGKFHFERLQVRHVEALMSKKKGPTAANTVKKNLSMLFNFAAKNLGYIGPNPARHAERMKTNPDGFHTWTDDEVSRFLERHGPGTKARLVMLLALNTGMARQDLARVGRQHVKAGRIA